MPGKRGRQAARANERRPSAGVSGSPRRDRLDDQQTAHRPHTGRTDIPLTERGEREAQALSARLKGMSFNMFSGGALWRFTVFALGIMPYISASIMMQLITAVSPQLDAPRARRACRLSPDRELRRGCLTFEQLECFQMSSRIAGAPPGGRDKRASL